MTASDPRAARSVPASGGERAHEPPVGLHDILPGLQRSLLVMVDLRTHCKTPLPGKWSAGSFNGSG